jgi:hypothetical protein
MKRCDFITPLIGAAVACPLVGCIRGPGGAVTSHYRRHSGLLQASAPQR